jgi:hypothetical protein
MSRKFIMVQPALWGVGILPANSAFSSHHV